MYMSGQYTPWQVIHESAQGLYKNGMLKHGRLQVFVLKGAEVSGSIPPPPHQKIVKIQMLSTVIWRVL